MSFIQELRGTRAALRASQLTINYGRFLAFYESRTESNTSLRWQDISGHGQHLSINSDNYLLLADDAGRMVYRASSGAPSWLVPPLSASPQDYTVYLVVRPATTNATFLFDSSIDAGGSDRLVLALNTSAGSLFRNSWLAPTLPLAVNELVVLTWRLNRAGATILVSNQLAKSGGYNPIALSGTTTFGRPFDSNINGFLGDLVALAVAPGNDTDAQCDEVYNYLRSL